MEAAIRRLALLSCLPLCSLATSVEAELTSETILAKVAEGNTKSHAVGYSGIREYRLRNYRFDKQAVVVVQVVYRPDTGKEFTVMQRSGSPKLLEILEKLFASETEASKPTKVVEYEISPANYLARINGVTTAGGRSYYAIDLIPKRKSKYLIKGTAWIDQRSYGIMRLEGVTTASVSIWVGSPHITQDFTQIDGVWLPSHTASFSSGLLLGASELEIQYSNYLAEDADHVVSSRVGAWLQQSQP